jgi:hypothetical protein
MSLQHVIIGDNKDFHVECFVNSLSYTQGYWNLESKPSFYTSKL